MEQPPYQPYEEKLGAPPPYFNEQNMGQQQQPPPQPYSQPPITTQPTQVVVQTPITVHHPTRLVCPFCQADVKTSVQYESGMMTHLLALILCFVFFPIACVPYCVNGSKDTTHQCPACNRHLALVKRL